MCWTGVRPVFCFFISKVRPPDPRISTKSRNCNDPHEKIPRASSEGNGAARPPPGLRSTAVSALGAMVQQRRVSYISLSTYLLVCICVFVGVEAYHFTRTCKYITRRNNNISAPILTGKFLVQVVNGFRIFEMLWHEDCFFVQVPRPFVCRMHLSCDSCTSIT